MSTMREGVCPQCGAEEVHRSKYDEIFTAVDGVFILVKTNFWSSETAKLRHYVCTNCGYMETYVPLEEDLQKIRESWMRITPLPKQKKKNTKG